MASDSIEQRIIRELSRRGTCSFLDLKSAVELPKGHISPITDRLARRGLVRIEKDHLDSHLSYTWTEPKEKAPGGKSSPAKKPPPSLPAPAVVSKVTSSRASREKTLPERLPPDWKQRLERSISISDYSQHPKEQKFMLQLLQKIEVEESANIIWEASRNVNPKWDASLFLERFQEVLFYLAVYGGLPRLTVKNIREIAAALEMIRDNEPFREEPAQEELERRILILRNREGNTSKTKPKDLGKRRALQYLRQYFQDHLQEPLDQATALLINATFDVKWTAATVRTRASELAVSGLKKATVINMTKESWAALDMLKGEELEAAMEKMSPRLLRRYLQSGG